MSLKEAAARAAVLGHLADRINDELKAAKATLQAELKAAKEASGTRQADAELPSGRTVAKVTLVTPKPAAAVTDSEAFLAWVRDNRPDQIERRFVTEVRPAFVKALLDEMGAAGVLEWCDKDTGVVHEVPGVGMQPRGAYHRVTFEKDGKDAIAAAWAAGELTALVLPELTAGGAE